MYVIFLKMLAWLKKKPNSGLARGVALLSSWRVNVRISCVKTITSPQKLSNNGHNYLIHIKRQFYEEMHYPADNL